MWEVSYRGLVLGRFVTGALAAIYARIVWDFYGPPIKPHIRRVSA